MYIIKMHMIISTAVLVSVRKIVKYACNVISQKHKIIIVDGSMGSWNNTKKTVTHKMITCDK